MGEMIRVQMSEELRRWRLAKGISQRKLARIIGAKSDYIQNIEHGKFEPTMTMLAKIIEALDKA